MSLAGQVAFVTGGASGIGAAVARRLAARGAALALADLNPPALEQARTDLTASGAQVLCLPLDVSDASQFAPFAAQVGRVLREVWQRDTFDFLLNNAGTGLHRAFSETTEA